MNDARNREIGAPLRSTKAGRLLEKKVEENEKERVENKRTITAEKNGKQIRGIPPYMKVKRRPEEDDTPELIGGGERNKDDAKDERGKNDVDAERKKKRERAKKKKKER